jgi:hypothetical protein
MDTKKNANGREEKDQPRRNQPSREAMARKLQIYADEEACWRRRSAGGRFDDSWSAASLARPDGVAGAWADLVAKGLNDRSGSTELAEVQAIHWLE